MAQSQELVIGDDLVIRIVKIQSYESKMLMLSRCLLAILTG